MITETHSQGYDIRNSMYDLLANNNYFANYFKRKTKMVAVQPGLLPYLGVYLIDETMVPDGDANAGCIRFNHTVRIGLSIINANNDQNAAELASDTGYWKAMQLWWTDLHLMNVLQNNTAGFNNDENVGIESIMRGTRRHIYGSIGASNETPFVEVQYDVNTFFRSEWYPDITDALNEIDVTVKVNNLNGNVQPVNIKYMFTALRAAMKKENQHGQRDN